MPTPCSNPDTGVRIACFFNSDGSLKSGAGAVLETVSEASTTDMIEHLRSLGATDNISWKT